MNQIANRPVAASPFPKRLLLVEGAFVALAIGCGSNHPGIAGGDTSGDGGGSGGATGDGGLSGFSGKEGGTADLFTVDVEDSSQIVVTSTSMSCHGECVDLKAVPQGGTAPYTYHWSDGSTGPTAHVCPTAGEAVTVSVTDTAQTGEFERPAETKTASVEITCSDGGALAQLDDAGVCASNFSFEGPVSMPPSAIDVPPWTTCGGFLMDGASILNSTISFPVPGGSPLPNLAPTDGQTNLQIYTNGFQSVTQPLCAPLHAGRSYSLLVDLASPTANDPQVVPGALAIYGGNVACTNGMSGTVLWTSPQTTPNWKTYCATFTPPEDMTYLSLAAVVPGGGSSGNGSYLYIDHMVPVASCP